MEADSEASLDEGEDELIDKVGSGCFLFLGLDVLEAEARVLGAISKFKRQSNRISRISTEIQHNS